MHQYQHEERCIEELGLAYKKVHELLDFYYDHFRSLFHRCALHHRKGIELIVAQMADEYGEEEARAAAELHIMDDLGRIPEDWNDMNDCWIPLGNEEELMHKIINDLYGEI